MREHLTLTCISVSQKQSLHCSIKLADTHFRRQILFQLLILLQHLLMFTPKEKARWYSPRNRSLQMDFTLDDTETKWVKETWSKAMDELKVTSPNGRCVLVLSTLIHGEFSFRYLEFFKRLLMRSWSVNAVGCVFTLASRRKDLFSTVYILRYDGKTTFARRSTRSRWIQQRKKTRASNGKRSSRR